MTQGSSPQAELADAVAKDLRTVVGKLKRRLRERSQPSDLTGSQTAVLLRLEADGPATIATLARAEGMRHQSMRTVVAPLLDTGLLRGTPDPNDRRQTLLSLTPKWLKSLEKGRSARQDWLAGRISESLSIAEQQRLRSALRLLDRVVRD